MKKIIKNYLAKLQENENKGFSLVELIIVMAIMAILVGIVASQVLPYMDKSRQSKDQQILSSICTDLVSATAQSGKDLGAANNVKVNGATKAAWSSKGSGWDVVFDQFQSLQTNSTIPANYNFKSKAAKNKDVEFTYDASTGAIKVYVAGHSSDDPDGSKYIVVSTSN